MKFLIISEAGDGAGLGVQLERLGHDVSIWTKDDEGHKRCTGLVGKTDEWNFAVEDDEQVVIIADCTGSGIICDLLRRRGYAVFGGSVLADRLEADRPFGLDFLSSAGINVPEGEHFTEWDEAEAFIQSLNDPTKLVFKPCGPLSGNLPSYVSADAEDMLRMLKFFRRQIGDSPEFLLQSFVKGIDISTEGFYNAQRSAFEPGFFSHTLETKHLMNDEVGPSGGCTGNIVWAVEDGEKDPLVGELFKLEPFLKEQNYGSGPIDLNSLVTPDGDIFGLELTPRFGYDAMPTFFLELFEGDVGEFLARLAGASVVERPRSIGSTGSFTTASPSLRSGFAAGVRISLPPWPSEDFRGPEGVPIRGLRGFEHFYPFDVMVDDEEELASCGAWGILGVVTGYAGYAAAAVDEAYSRIKKLRIPNMQYRSDLAEVFAKRLAKVRSSLLVKV